MEQKIDDLFMEDVAELTPLRQFADTIVQMLTKDQLKILKSRLQFDPRKLPLTKQTLVATLQQSDEATYDALRLRFSKLIDVFEALALPEQIESLHGYKNHISELMEQEKSDFQHEQLYELETLLETFLDGVKIQHNPLR